MHREAIGAMQPQAKQPRAMAIGARGHPAKHAPQAKEAILKPNAATLRKMKEAQADRANDTMENLSCKLAELPSAILRNVWRTPGFRLALEQAKKIDGPDSDNIVCEEDCEDIDFEKVDQRAQQYHGRHLYGERELLLHKQMWDAMRRDKEGVPKDHDFGYWCRRVADHSESCRAVRGRPLADSAATENADISASYRALAEDILAHDLTNASPQVQAPRGQSHHDETA